MTGERLRGQVYRMTDKGFGFVRIDGERTPVFLHMTNVRGHTRTTPIDIFEGDRVEFDLEETDKGFRGLDIVVLN
jgi:cold shock CspA family protein